MRVNLSLGRTRLLTSPPTWERRDPFGCRGRREETSGEGCDSIPRRTRLQGGRESMNDEGKIVCPFRA